MLVKTFLDRAEGRVPPFFCRLRIKLTQKPVQHQHDYLSVTSCVCKHTRVTFLYLSFQFLPASESISPLTKLPTSYVWLPLTVKAKRDQNTCSQRTRTWIQKCGEIPMVMVMLHFWGSHSHRDRVSVPH